MPEGEDLQEVTGEEPEAEEVEGDDDEHEEVVEEVEEEYDDDIRQVKASRFNQLNKEAKLAKKLRDATGWTDAQIEAYLDSQLQRGAQPTYQQSYQAQGQAQNQYVDHEARNKLKNIERRSEKQELLETYPNLRENKHVVAALMEDYDGNESMVELYERKYKSLLNPSLAKKRKVKKMVQTETSASTQEAPELSPGEMTLERFSKLKPEDRAKFVKKNIYRG